MLFCVNEKNAQMTEVVSGLYICGVTALTAENMQKYNIALIVNATTEVPNARSLGSIARVKLWLEDTTKADLYPHLHLLCDQIEEAISQGANVLVHCVAGVSRSAAICLAFLVKYHNMSLRDAYFHMASRRPLVRPNLGFWRQLIAFEQEVTETCGSVRLVRFNDQLIPDVYVQPEEEKTTQRPSRISSRPTKRHMKFMPALETLTEIAEAAA